METMEVDLHIEGTSWIPEDSPAMTQGVLVHSPIVLSNSGSSTEVDEDDDESHLPATWAFSQQATTGVAGAATLSASRGATRRLQQRVRSGLSVHYSSQNVVRPRHFLDFVLQTPSASGAELRSDSTTEVTESDSDSTLFALATAPEEIHIPASPPTLNFGPPRVEDSLPQQPSLSVSNAATHTARTETAEQIVQLSPVNLAPGSVAPGSVALSVQQPQSLEGDGEGDTCPICFEPFTIAGEHRLATLRCGHFFGNTCIERWLKDQGQAAKCPQCNKKAKRTDIILLYARRLRAIDNAEQVSMKRSLKLEQSLRRKAELESAQCRLQMQMMTDEYGKLQRQVQELKALIAQTGSNSSFSSLGVSHGAPSGSQRLEGSRSYQYTFSKAVLLSQYGGCRVLSYCERLSCLLASQPSPHSTLVPGYGVKMVSTVNMKAGHYVPIHSKQIRGLAFNRENDTLMLSAALDNTIKLTSLLTNTVVQTYNTGKPVWSCCWCLDNTSYLYAGLNNGSVLVYDTRDTSRHVQELQPLQSRSPVVSLSYVPRKTVSSFPYGGVVAGSLEQACFWENMNMTKYRPHLLPLETGGCTDIQVNTESRHCLVTYRPGRTNPTIRCILMELKCTPQQDSNQSPSCSFSPVHVFSAGTSCKLLTKNAVFESPAGGGANLVCAGDEASQSAMVWDAGTGVLIQKLPADLPVLDICPFVINMDHYLAALTEKMLKIYKWE